VTGEKNSPSAGHAGVKDDQNGHQCLGVFNWATLPQGYSGLALQVEWWATDRQPVTIKKANSQKTQIVASENSRVVGINSDSGEGYKMTVEDSNLECGIVYEQILINAKLQIGKRDQKHS
jgi:hypothetical protein